MLQRACKKVVHKSKTSLAKLLAESASASKIETRLCTKICEEEKPRLIDWVDEPFTPRFNEDLDQEATKLSIDKMHKAVADAGMKSHATEL